MLESLHVPFAVTVPMKLTQRLALALSALTIAAAAHAAPLRIGVTPGALADSVEVAAAEARKQGLDVKVVELTDW
ncbi:UNVERIFIED_CONTAM: MetQ/NlpA family ABC transporter substrate-binding protein, partial [Salmonella enterica subsp. enterica serovar Rissen]